MMIKCGRQETGFSNPAYRTLSQVAAVLPQLGWDCFQHYGPVAQVVRAHP